MMRFLRLRMMFPLMLPVLFCCSASAAAPENCGLAEGSLLPDNDETVFEFTQNKMISAISRPLKSSGLLGLSEGGELLWQTRQPLKSTIVIGDGRVRIFNREDALVNELSNPTIQQMSNILLQVFSADSTALTNTFASTTSCADDGRWQIDLRPRSAELARLLLSVSVAGQAGIETIRFTEQRGDTTEIMLSPVLQSRLEELESYLEH